MKHSTYARMLKPGQCFSIKGDSRIYTVTGVNVSTWQDTTTVVLAGGVEMPPLGEMVMVRVHTMEHSHSITFDGTDRVELL